MTEAVEIAVVGAGIAGIATAYYLCCQHGKRDLVLLDPRPPMSLTSAQSGENYRNWWPHPVMTAFTDLSIDLMEAIARDSDNRLHMTRRGYALATRRADLDGLLADLERGYGAGPQDLIRVHDKGGGATYRPADSADWRAAPGGVDLLRDQDLIRRTFPGFDPTVSTVIHIRRAGDISGQQMGQFMLERIREAGGRLLPVRLIGADHDGGFRLETRGQSGTGELRAEAVVNAAGPFAGPVAALLGADLPIETVLQQKVAFEDREGVIPRAMPFAIDLDGQTIDWSEEERALLREDPATAWLAEPMMGGMHCRPDGGEQGRWVKLGWAYNRGAAAPCEDPALDPNFPEILLRGVSRLQPGLKTYYGRLPRAMTHYGGFYAMTPENWPLVGATDVAGAFVVGALSGFGTMAACAAGALCAAAVAGAPQPDYAAKLGPARYGDAALMAELNAMASKGLL